VAGKSAGFAIGIGINDGASAGLDAINRRIAAMHAPADRFNKSMAKFGEVTGINRAAEGLQTMGDRALGAARAVERMAGPMAALTSLSSVGGMIAYAKAWASAGNEVSRTSSLLNTPVSRLSALRGAARLGGISVEAMDSSLKGLGDRLADVKFHRAGAPLVSLMNQFKISAEGVGGAARTGADAIGDVMKAAATYKDPHAQQRFLEQFGISPEMAVLIKDNQSQLEKLLAKTQRTGGVMTEEMAANGKKMEGAWTELAETLEGVGNRIANNWSGTVTKMLDSTSHWIQEQEKLGPTFDQNVTHITAAIAGLGLLRVAPWILRAMGWLELTEIAPVVAIGVGAENLPPANLQTGGNTGSLLTPGGIGSGTGSILDPAGQARSMSSDDYAPEGPSWWQRALGFIGGRRPGGGMNVPGGGGIGATHGDSSGNALDPATAARAKLVHDGLMSRGMDSKTAWGFAGNAVQESRADFQSRPGDNGAAHGLMMWRDSADGGHRYSDYIGRYGHAPEQGSLNESLDNIMAELKGPEARAWANIQRTGGSEGEKAAAVSTFYERPKDTAAEESRRWGLAQRLSAMFPDSGPGAAESGQQPAESAALTGPTSNLFPRGDTNGRVQVEIVLHGAPHGTTATVVTSGAAIAAPPRIETSMPMAR
jgi:hypothetical protein